MRLIRNAILLLAVVLSVGIVFAQQQTPNNRLNDTYLHGGEFDSNAGFITYWKRHDASPKDKRLCKGVGYNGSNCAFQFFGNKTEKTRLTQVSRLNNSAAPSELHYGFLSGRAKPMKGEVNLRFIVTFLFNNGAPALKTTYDYTGTGPVEEYEMIYFETASTFAPNTVKTSKINIRNFSPNQSIVLIDSLFMGVNVAGSSK